MGDIIVMEWNPILIGLAGWLTFCILFVVGWSRLQNAVRIQDRATEESLLLVCMEDTYGGGYDPDKVEACRQYDEGDPHICGGCGQWVPDCICEPDDQSDAICSCGDVDCSRPTSHGDQS